MYDSLFEFFETYIFNDNYSALLDDTEVGFFNVSISLQSYLCTLASLISIIFILVLCCLFVYKIIKLIGGLIR